MYLIKRTGETFATRKEIKDYLGVSRFRRFLKKGEALFISKETLDRMNETTVLKNGSYSIH